MVKLLLEHHADPNGKYFTNDPLLFSAIAYGQIDIAMSLVRAGADVNLREPMSGTTSVNIGRKTVEWSDEGETPLMEVACSNLAGSIDMLRFLLSKGADINARDKAGRTALMWAAAQGKPEAMHFLLQHGADPKVRDKDGYTALTIEQSQKR